MANTTTAEWPDEVRAVYVLCHPVKEKARWDRLLPHLLSRGIPKDRIRVCAPTWGADLSVDEIFKFYNPFLRRGQHPTYTFKGFGLTRGEISLGINFGAVVMDVTRKALGECSSIGAPEEGLILTFESDVWLRDDFVPRLRDLLADAAPQRWDYISLGEGVGTRPPGVPPSYYAPTKAYTPPHRWVFRCTDSMLFKTDYLKRLSTTYFPFKEIIDWEQNYQLGLHGGSALWADPPLAEQGTCVCRMETSLPA